MRVLMAVVVGMLSGVVFGIIWIGASLALLAWPGSGGLGAVSGVGISTLVVVLIGFGAGFVWMIRR